MDAAEYDRREAEWQSQVTGATDAQLMAFLLDRYKAETQTMNKAVEDGHIDEMCVGDYKQIIGNREFIAAEAQKRLPPGTALLKI